VGKAKAAAGFAGAPLGRRKGKRKDETNAAGSKVWRREHGAKYHNRQMTHCEMRKAERKQNAGRSLPAPRFQRPFPAGVFKKIQKYEQ